MSRQDIDWLYKNILYCYNIEILQQDGFFRVLVNLNHMNYTDFYVPYDEYFYWFHLIESLIFRNI